MIIAQISDLHVQPAGQKAYGIVDTNQFLAAAIAHLNRMNPQPDLVIATGDLVDEGTEAEYEMLRELVASLKAPLFFALGNHDNRTAFRHVFSQESYAPTTGFFQYVLTSFPVRIVVLDTLVEGEGYGDMDAPRLAWLADRLAEAPDTPTLLFMHHPPFETGIASMDQIRCKGGEAMAELIVQYPNVLRVACGHLHRSIQTLWAGTLGTVAPSVAHQVALRLTADFPAAFTMEPPGFHLHLWNPSSGVVTHTVPIGTFDAYSYETKAAIAL